VILTAHCGVGTLLPTGKAESGPDGHYVLRFHAGVRMGRLFGENGGTGLQAATISPAKPGYFDANLNRQGDLLMADRLPASGENGGWKGDTNRVVLPRQPRELNFVMLPAATIEGRLLDGEGKPLGGQNIWLTGDRLPPSSSVLDCASTGPDGTFHFAQVPAIGHWWFVTRSPSLNKNGLPEELRSEDLSFLQGVRERIEVRLHPADTAHGLHIVARAAAK
ncbi:MAG TPA: hypothetical protein VHH73_16945, partial [Verrucomicrobiae bacterium]|nr:hypothetical protein [Verrucomicrobiae bacterium]